MLSDYMRIARHAKNDYEEVIDALKITLNPEENSIIVEYPHHCVRCKCERELFSMLEIAKFAMNTN